MAGTIGCSIDARALQGSGGGAAPAAGGRVQAHLQPGEAHFVETLKEDVNGLNDFFIEREEDFVIRMEALVSQQAELAESDAERQAALRSSFIDLHGAREPCCVVLLCSPERHVAWTCWY